MQAFIGWLSAHPDVLGIAAFVGLSLAGQFAPHTPFWDGVRSWLADVSQKNLKALPADVTADVRFIDELDAGGFKKAQIEISVGGKILKTVPVSYVTADVLRAGAK